MNTRRHRLYWQRRRDYAGMASFACFGALLLIVGLCPSSSDMAGATAIGLMIAGPCLHFTSVVCRWRSGTANWGWLATVLWFLFFAFVGAVVLLDFFFPPPFLFGPYPL